MAKINEKLPIKRKQGQRGPDKKPRKKIDNTCPMNKDDLSYWKITLDMVEKQLSDYLASEKVRTYKKEIKPGNPTSLTIDEFIKNGLQYFRITLGTGRSLTINGLCLYLMIDPVTLMRMEQVKDASDYKNDIFKPVSKLFKKLLGMFHEEMGNKKMNPMFHMFVLKSMRGGFQDVMEFQLGENEGAGMPEAARLALRDKVKNFTEDPDIKQIAAKSKTLTYGKDS